MPLNILMLRYLNKKCKFFSNTKYKIIYSNTYEQPDAQDHRRKLLDTNNTEKASFSFNLDLP